MFSSHRYCSILRSPRHHQSNSVFCLLHIACGPLEHNKKFMTGSSLHLFIRCCCCYMHHSERTACSPRIWPWWSWLNWEKWAEVIRSMIALGECLVPCFLAGRIEIDDPTALSSNAKKLESVIVGAWLFKNRSTQRRILMSTSPSTCRKLRIGVFSTVALSTSTAIASVTAEQDLRES